MKIEDLVSLLESDLANEYAHWHFYVQASTSVTGLHRQEIGEFFSEQASSEMEHVGQFRRLIQGIKTRRKIPGEVPSTVAEFSSGNSDPIELLKAALEMEDKVVSNYVLRHSQAEAIANSEQAEHEDIVDATYVALFLEDQILDSRGDADNILEMLEGKY